MTVFPAVVPGLVDDELAVLDATVVARGHGCVVERIFREGLFAFRKIFWALGEMAFAVASTRLHPCLVGGERTFRGTVDGGEIELRGEMEGENGGVVEARAPLRSIRGNNYVYSMICCVKKLQLTCLFY